MSDDNDWDKVKASDADSATDAEEPELIPDTSSPPRKEKPTTDTEKEAVSKQEEEEETEIGPDSKQCPIQIVSIGNESNEYAFTFHEQHLNSVLSKIPPGWKVSVVSVVGAFRTGKSFLLSWFLQYLNHFSSDAVARRKKEGKQDTGKKWYEELDSLGNDGFHWRGGAERNTTGIWIWSHPFFLTRNHEGKEEDVAVIIIDTQGMFDHETTMALTASIFGLSTLLSSYQIYNVDKRIQEDNLQQLALFSEYGRLALMSDGQAENSQRLLEAEELKKILQPTAADLLKSTKGMPPKDVPTPSSSPKRKSPKKDKTKTTATPKPKPKPTHKPFQTMEFLVRDWQNFEDDEDLPACLAEMPSYLDSVLAERQASDLKDTREQITSCFENLSCFMMTHPGFAVTKKKYQGEVSVIDPTFLTFLDAYCHRVFGEGKTLVPKKIHGRELTAIELGAYIKAYAQMFEGGAHFPTACTMLDATASANNVNATNLSIQKYKEKMDKIAGTRCTRYLDPDELRKSHVEVYGESMNLFEKIANFGNQKSIEKARDVLVRAVEDCFEIYSKLNDSRNPLAGFETFIIPMLIAFISIVLRWIADTTCTSWSQTCKAGSDVLSHVYQVVFFFMVLVSLTKMQQISELVRRLKKAFDAMSGHGSNNEKDVSEEKKKS